MNLAETAVLSVQLKLNDQLSGGVAKAEGELAGLNATTKASGGHLTALAGRAGIASGAMGKFSGALGHAKGAIGGLVTGPLGLIGLSAGLFSLGGLFESSVRHASDMGFAVEKLTGLTGESAASMSTLLVTFEKFGITAEKTTQIVGFTEKTLGNLTTASVAAGGSADALLKAQERLRVAQLKLLEVEHKRHLTGSQLLAAQNRVADATRKVTEITKNAGAATTRAADIAKKFGVTLTDAKGRALPFGVILGKVADYYNSNAEQSKKAALSALLFGRGYAQIIPILKLGSKGIAEAEASAKALGLTLTAENAKDLKEYRGAIRDVGEAIGGLQLQLGLKFIPIVKDAAIALTGFLEHGGRDKIVGFFTEAVGVGEGFVQFVAHELIPTVYGVAHGLLDLWNTIPGPLRDLLVKGYVTTRVVKFLFGVDVVGSIGSAISGAVAGAVGKSVGSAVIAAGIGKAFVQPVFVTNMGVGGLGGGLPVAAGGAAAAGASLASFLIAALPIAVGAGIVYATAQNKGGYDPRDLRRRQGTTVADTARMFGGVGTTPQGYIDERPRTVNPILRPGSVDSPRTTAADLATLESALARGRAAGFKPIGIAAAEATNQRNVLRAQERARLAVLKVGGDTHSELVGIRNAILGLNIGGTTNIYSGNTGRGTPMKHPGLTAVQQTQDRREGNITIKAVATTRDISTAHTIKARFGPTISQAGGI